MSQPGEKSVIERLQAVLRALQEAWQMGLAQQGLLHEQLEQLRAENKRLRSENASLSERLNRRLAETVSDNISLSETPELNSDLRPDALYDEHRKLYDNVLMDATLKIYEAYEDKRKTTHRREFQHEIRGLLVQHVLYQVDQRLLAGDVVTEGWNEVLRDELEAALRERYEKPNKKFALTSEVEAALMTFIEHSLDYLTRVHRFRGEIQLTWGEPEMAFDPMHHEAVKGYDDEGWVRFTVFPGFQIIKRYGRVRVATAPDESSIAQASDEAEADADASDAANDTPS